MTNEQKQFQIGLSILKRLNETEKVRELTPKEQNQRDITKEKLFGIVIKYGMQLATQRMGKYSKDSDAYNDVIQEIATIFYEKLYDYDPKKVTPTTFFKPYFNQAISEYVHKYSQHLKSHDAKNIGLINQAIQKYERQGIKWDEQLLQLSTGLSASQVKKTLYFAKNSKRAAIEDAEIMPSVQPTPEEYYLQNERHNVIIKELVKELNPKDVDFFLTKVKLDGEKEITFKELASKYHTTIKDAKQRYNNIITKLSNNKNIQHYRYNISKKNIVNQTKDTIELNDASGSIMEVQITREIEKLEYLQIQINLKENLANEKRKKDKENQKNK